MLESMQLNAFFLLKSSITAQKQKRKPLKKKALSTSEVKGSLTETSSSFAFKATCILKYVR